MKEAMWGVGLIFVTMFGIFLVNTFGNIAVVNQQDFTAMTNTVEAAMNDAIDYAHYRSGFCVCSHTGSWTFTSSSQYEITDPVDSACPLDKNCRFVEGEYKIDKDVFRESLSSRFDRAVRGDKYSIIISDIIEYPPKVSVMIVTDYYEKEVEISGGSYGGGDETIEYGGDYTIVNNINSILESYSTYEAPPEPVLPTPAPTPKPSTPKPSAPKPSSPSNPSTPKPSTPKPSTPKPSTPKPSTPKPKPSCFLAGTKIATITGYKSIEKIKVGDYVLSYNDCKNINEYKKVVNVFKRENAKEELYTIKTDDTEFSLTGHHGVYTMRDGKYPYIAAMELKVGDIVKYSDGKFHEIKSISHHPIENVVYNLEVEDNHNFYVGDKKILVHNMQVGQGCWKSADPRNC